MRVAPLLQIVKEGSDRDGRWVAWLRLPARRSQTKTVGCKFDSVDLLAGGYLEGPESYMVTVDCEEKVAVACWAQKVDGWPRM